MPTFEPTHPLPSLAPDQDLLSHFPSQIDGQPLTNVSAQSWLPWVCYWSGDAGLASASEGMPAGVDLTRMTIGSATATIDGQEITFNAFRLAGGDSSQLVQGIIQAAQPDSSGSLSQVNVGGKDVYKWTTQGDSSADFAYASGDTLFVLASVTDTQAAKILAALQ